MASAKPEWMVETPRNFPHVAHAHTYTSTCTTRMHVPTGCPGPTGRVRVVMTLV